MYRIKAFSYPNNEIRVVKSQSPPLRSSSPCDDDGVVGELYYFADELSLHALDEENLPPLSLGPNSQTQRSSAGYGSLPIKPSHFGLNAKRSLIRQGAALESEAPHEQCLFLTGTLPGSTEDSFRAIAQWSGHIVHRLKSWVGNYERQKLDFYCWEYQKRGALHLHYCVWIRDDDSRRAILSGFHAWWVQILHSISEKSLTDMFRKNSSKTHLGDTSKVRAVAEVCKKSPARYLAKYLSKSSTPTRGSARAFTPSRWWGTSRPLKALCEKLTSVIDIVEGGYHVICRKWEEVNHVASTSDSVTFDYSHKFGMGHTFVCYPKTSNERENLWSQMASLSTLNQGLSTNPARIPSVVLRVHRDRVVHWLSQSLANLSPSFQGLKVALENYLSMMRILTPSTSQAPLGILLAWAARTSDIRSLCQFTPVASREMTRMFDTLLDDLEWAIEEVATNGWH